MRLGRLDAPSEWAADQDTRRVGAVLFGLTAAFAVLGALDRAGLPLGLFDLDGEAKPPALFSALLLAAAAALSALVALRWRERRWVGLSAFFAFMAIDEGATLHEIVQNALMFDWQYVYLPIAALGGVAWLLVYARLEGRERMLFALGALAWVVSQVDEHFQSNPEEGRVDGYGALATIEETLELAGTVLFVLALHMALRRVWRSRPSARA